MNEVKAKIRSEIKERSEHWDDAGLEALRDRRIAAYGPAMEVAGQWREVRDNRGRPVDMVDFLAFARRVVTEFAELKIGNMPADAFDVRTRFALAWTSQHARRKVLGSEARWERLTHDVTEADTVGLLCKVGNKTRFILAEEGKAHLEAATADSVVDLALGVASCGKSLKGISQFLAKTSASEDEMLWAAIAQLAADLPDTDPDGDVWTWAIRNRNAIESGIEQAIAHDVRQQRRHGNQAAQTRLDL